MDINRIADDILKQENNQLAQAFTMVIGSLLLSKNINPIINKSCEEWNETDDLNKYIIRKEYNVTFDIDTSEHDAKVRADAIDECIQSIKNRWIMWDIGVINAVIEQLENLREQR